MSRTSYHKNPVYTEEQRIVASENLNKIVRTAALELCANGKLLRLANKAGISYEGLIVALRRGWLTGPMACAIESAVGRDVITKEALCPHKYPV